MNTKGKLFLIPNTLGDDRIHAVIPHDVITAVKPLKYFIAEHSKSARAFLKLVEIDHQQSELEFFELNKHTDRTRLHPFLEPLKQGHNMGLISDAGCPGIADPGAEIVALAHELDIEVVPFVGPSSILLAHMASGMNGQSFAFNGYLPIDKADRKKKIQFLDNLAQKGQSQSFIETPYRNKQMFQDILAHCKANTKMCIAYDITLPSESIKTKSVQAWKKHKMPDFHKKPCIFILG
ncbi:MAG: SAM-dependent methyltransferase [Flavobacteriales bacterium]